MLKSVVFVQLAHLLIAIEPSSLDHVNERHKIADKMREGFLTVSLKDLLVLPRLLRRLPEMTSYEQARAIVSQNSKPLATIVEALGHENRLNRLERSSKLNVEAKLFFQKLEDQKKESIKNAVLLYELQTEAVKKNIQEVYPTTAKFFAEHSSAPKTTSLISDLFPIAQNEAVSEESSRLEAQIINFVN